MDYQIKNPNKHLTAIERYTLSFPARHLYELKKLKGRVLDFGCGFGKDVEILRDKKKLNIEAYDPHYFPELPAGKFDTIICTYVLGILFQEEQAKVLMQISSLLKPGGKAYISLRRDFRKEGFCLHSRQNKYIWQSKVQLPYKSIFHNPFTEIYEYKHFTRTNKKKLPVRHPDKPGKALEIVFESATAYAIRHPQPLVEGHCIILPKKTGKNYFDLSFRAQSALWFMANHVKEHLQKTLKPASVDVKVDAALLNGEKWTNLQLLPSF
jgi:diadenosine tetraphosphate (Ap4A) HIT family hydrolase